MKTTNRFCIVAIICLLLYCDISWGRKVTFAAERSSFPHGLTAAVYSPFDTNGALNLTTISDQAKLLLSTGVYNVFVCGTTGESMSLTVEERKKIAEEWVKVAGSDITVIVHVGHTSVEVAKDLTRHAEKIGAAAIGAMAPFFFKPATVSDLVLTMSEIAKEASSLPFYYYHIPSMTGVDFKVLDFFKEADRTGLIPTLKGAKFSDSDLLDFGECVAYEHGKYAMVFGKDEILVSALALGATGAVGMVEKFNTSAERSTYNFGGDLYNKLITHFEDGDIEKARTEQTRSQQLVSLCEEYGQLPAQKALMGWKGVDVGPARLPLAQLTSEQKKRLKTELQNIGWL